MGEEEILDQFTIIFISYVKLKAYLLHAYAFRCGPQSCGLISNCA